MKWIAGVTISVILGATTLFPQRPLQSAEQQGDAEQELLLLNEQVIRMQLQKDVVAAQTLLSDDYIFIQADGETTNKMENMDVLRDPEFVLESMVAEDVEVRLYCDTALVVGRAVVGGNYRGRTLDGQFRYTDVWVKSDGRWQNVLSQATRLPSQ